MPYLDGLLVPGSCHLGHLMGKDWAVRFAVFSPARRPASVSPSDSPQRVARCTVAGDGSKVTEWCGRASVRSKAKQSTLQDPASFPFPL